MAVWVIGGMQPAEYWARVRRYAEAMLLDAGLGAWSVIIRARTAGEPAGARGDADSGFGDWGFAVDHSRREFTVAVPEGERVDSHEAEDAADTLVLRLLDELAEAGGDATGRRRTTQ
jgi:hypothetical protein